MDPSTCFLWTLRRPSTAYTETPSGRFCDIMASLRNLSTLSGPCTKTLSAESSTTTSSLNHLMWKPEYSKYVSSCRSSFQWQLTASCAAPQKEVDADLAARLPVLRRRYRATC
ncbi:hypothetical protein DPMN_180761 [Dreissena polymorpha]|uniref:Uncharacterized protein n=1 Tax=Dreissena polymorpha TaxID=45954 RepID=A0A9D4DBH6_DREPO|nr:hypothetical protein DPMN_180761 [Dreissena polymorpha]